MLHPLSLKISFACVVPATIATSLEIILTEIFLLAKSELVMSPFPSS